MTNINPYSPMSSSLTTKQQKDLDQRKAVRTRRARRGLKEKLHNAGTGAIIAGPGTVIVSSIAADIFAGVQWPANLILIPLVVPGGIVGGIYGWIKGPRKKLRPIPTDDQKLLLLYLQKNKSENS